MSFPNVWNHRKVADTSAKGCEICFKPSTSVLVTPENKDFFYVCPSHLKDSGFCSPIIDHEAVAAKKKKMEMDEEVERVKREYEEKQRKKNEKESEKESDKKDDKKDDKDKDKKDDKKEEPKPNHKEMTKPEQNVEEEPRVFSLQRTFYQQRIDRKRQAEMAKRNRERLGNPSFFPSVPKGQP